MTQVARNILASVLQLHLNLVPACLKLVVSTIRKYAEQTLIIIHAVKFTSLTCLPECVYTFPADLRWTKYQQFFQRRPCQSWFVLWDRFFQVEYGTSTSSYPSSSAKGSSNRPGRTCLLTMSSFSRFPINFPRIKKWNVISVTRVGVTSRAVCMI